MASCNVMLPLPGTSARVDTVVSGEPLAMCSCSGCLPMRVKTGKMVLVSMCVMLALVLQHKCMACSQALLVHALQAPLTVEKLTGGFLDLDDDAQPGQL